MKYRKKPVVIDAFLLHDPSEMNNEAAHKHNNELAEFMGDAEWESDNDGINITTLEGVMKARPGDFIIKGVAGEYYPCKPDIFMATYEAVE